tara:strand:+ start:11170 stop:11595 length:426 start_codon:yes stop_codon:yes gene_type:complete
MKPEETFCINEPGVISEVIEGEAIVLNFESGTYYSLNDSYLALWEGIARGVPAGDLPAHLAQRYPGTAADFAGDVEHALRQLLDEQLIRAEPRAAADVPPADVSNVAYAAPVLQKFTDLQELLLLDPIHDLDEVGHPLGGG